MSTIAAVSTSAREASWSERGATAAMFLVLGIAFGAWAAALPGIKADLALSDRDLSFALLILAVGSVSATIGAGSLAPRIGTGRATAFGALGVCLTLGLLSEARSLPQLSALAALFGIANGFLDVSMNGHASEVERRWGASIMSSFHGVFSLGGLFGATAGGLLQAAGLGASGEMIVLTVLNAGLVLASIPSLGRGVKSEPHEIGLAWPVRAAWGLCAIAFCGLMIEGAMADWSAIYLATVVRISESVSAAGYAAFSVTMTIGRLTGDLLIRRVGARPVVIGGAGMAAAGLACSVAFPTFVPATLGFLLVGLGLANVTPAVFSAAGRFGRTPATGIAAVAGIGYAGFISGPPLIGTIATWTDLRVALGFLIVVALGAMLAGVWFRWAPAWDTET